jgi:uncharacterized glyoxalase superfamily protein PhnB
MSSEGKPKGYSTVSVYIVTEGAQRVIDFLKSTFDATDLRHFDTPDGKIMHAEVRIGDAVVMIADASERYPAFAVWLHVYVPDVDATYQRALAAGGLSVEEPSRREGETDRRGGVRDSGGNTWWIATHRG